MYSRLFRTIINEIEHLKIAEVKLADVMFYNERKNELFFERDIDRVDVSNIPVGVVVIPASHDVYGDGTPGVMALQELTGAYGKREQVGGEPFTNSYAQIINDTTTKTFLDGTTKSANASYAYLPTDAIISYGTPVPDDDDLRWGTSLADPLIACPYKMDGPNPLYGAGSTNVFKKFSNRTIIKGSTTDRIGWRNDASIIDGNENIKQAWAKCWLYTTPGTNNGDWYLPSAYEFGYVSCRHLAITNVFNKLNTKWPESCKLFNPYSNYLTGTQAFFQNWPPMQIRVTNGYCTASGTNATTHPFRPFFNMGEVVDDEGNIKKPMHILSKPTIPDSYVEPESNTVEYEPEIMVYAGSEQSLINPIVTIKSGSDNIPVMDNSTQGIDDPSTAAPRIWPLVVSDVKFADVTNLNQVDSVEWKTPFIDAERTAEYDGGFYTSAKYITGDNISRTLYGPTIYVASDEGSGLGSGIGDTSTPIVPETPSVTTKYIRLVKFKLPKVDGLNLSYIMNNFVLDRYKAFWVRFSDSDFFDKCSFEGWTNIFKTLNTGNYWTVYNVSSINIENAPTNQSLLDELPKIFKRVFSVAQSNWDTCINISFRNPDDPIIQKWLETKPSYIKVK